MGGYAKHRDVLYLVSWDAEGIVKAGVSNRQRWRKFTLRGGRLLGLWTAAEPYDLEGAVHRAMHRRSRLAFLDGERAVPYLGGRGDGYRECYIMPAHEAIALVMHMHPHRAIAYASASCPRNAIASSVRLEHGRTDGRTDLRRSACN